MERKIVEINILNLETNKTNKKYEHSKTALRFIIDTL